MKVIFIFIFLIAFTIKSYSITPLDSLRQVLKEATSSAEKSKTHQQIALYWGSRQQQDSVINHINSMLAFAEKSDMDLFDVQITSANDILFSAGGFDYAEKLNNKYLNIFKKENNRHGLAVCYFNLGRIQQFTGNISEASKFLSKAHSLFKEKGMLNSAISTSLGGVFSRQGKYTEALQILTDALSVTDSVKDIKSYCGLLFTIGNTYGQINDQKTAIKYFKRVLSLTESTGDIMGKANTLTNLATANSDLGEFAMSEKYAREALAIVTGRNLMAESEVLSVLTGVLLQQNKYDELEGFFNRMYQIGEMTGNDFNKYLADMGMAHVAYHNKDYQKSIQLLQQSLPQLEEQGAWAETIPGYKLLYENYNELGDYKNALDASTKFHNYTDSTYNQDKVKELALLQSRLTFQKKELIYEKEQRVKNVIIVALIIIFLLSTLLAIFIFKNKQKLNRQKQMLLNAQLERTEHILRLSESKLNDFASRIQEKTKLVENMQEQLESFIETDSNLMMQLQQSTILTEDDWQHFKSLFEQVHTGFLTRLKEKYPEISPAEIRYLTLAKLRLSTKEMASALGVSTQSIRTNWYRIRKKINLPEEMTVEELVAKI